VELSILLPIAYFLVLGFLLWLIWPIFMGAIFLPTPMNIVMKMLDIAEVGEGDVVYDLGSGDGRIIIEAARRGAKSVGVEVDLIRVLWSRMRAQRFGERVKVVRGDFFKTPLTGATIVTVYQGESINNRLKAKFEAELPPGTRLVSFDFKFEGWEPEKMYVEDKVYLYRVPAKA
jgi:SAM-dependent methyltransferase